MQRSDLIAALALVTAIVALFWRPAAPVHPVAPDHPLPTATTTHFGNLYLEPQGEGACKVDRKEPETIQVQDGDWVFWTVHNNCERAAELEFFDPQGASGNRSRERNPLSAVVGGPIPGKTSSSSIGWLVKTREQLRPGAGEGRDKWTYKWRLNNAVQQDPEIEIEYRRGR